MSNFFQFTTTLLTGVSIGATIVYVFRYLPLLRAFEKINRLVLNHLDDQEKLFDEMFEKINLAEAMTRKTGSVISPFQLK